MTYIGSALHLMCDVKPVCKKCYWKWFLYTQEEQLEMLKHWDNFTDWSNKYVR